MTGTSGRGYLSARALLIGLGLTPLWYALGADQFIWPAIAAVVLPLHVLEHLAARHLPLISRQTLPAALLIFVFVHVASGVSFVWIPQAPYLFLRDLTLFFAAWTTSNTIASRFDERDCRAVLRLLAQYGGLAAAISLLAVVGLGDFEFRGLASRFMPPAFLANPYFDNMVLKTPVEMGEWDPVYRYGPFESKRPRGLFMDANAFGVYMGIVIPIGYWWARSMRSAVARSLMLMGLAASVAALMLSLSRTAYLAVLAASLGVLAIGGLRGFVRRLPGLLVVVLFVGVLTAVVPPDLWLGRAGGAGDVTRLIVYEATLQGIADQPFLGHATLIRNPVSNALPPLGSHSFVLHVLFTQGLVGFVLLTAAFGAGVRAALDLRYAAPEDPRLVTALVFGLFAAGVAALSYDWLFDAVAFMAVWVLAATAARLRTLAVPAPSAEGVHVGTAAGGR